MSGGSPTVSRRRRRSESDIVPPPLETAYMETFFSKLKFIATDKQPIQVVENEGTISNSNICLVVVMSSAWEYRGQLFKPRFRQTKSII